MIEWKLIFKKLGHRGLLEIIQQEVLESFPLDMMM